MVVLAGIGEILGMIIPLAISVIVIMGFWKAFVKAGKPGWACLVPIYNFIVILEIANKPTWWFILLFVPVANIVVIFLVSIEVAKNFGKSTGFGIGLALVGGIFWPILGFSDAKYIGDGASSDADEGNDGGDGE